MAEKTEGEKQEHKSIFEALAAFHGENPEIKKTKEFGKEGEKMHFFYSPLDEMLDTVRPLTSKHGLAFVWEDRDGKMVCALYHETYATEEYTETTTTEDREGEKISSTTKTEKKVREKGVLRSMPIKVTREGDMKDIGRDSTYARRYTLAEVLGLAPEDDRDAEDTKEKLDKAQNFAFNSAKRGIDNAKTVEDVNKGIDIIKKEITRLDENKKTTFGLEREQYEELVKMGEDKIAKLEGGQEEAPDDVPAVEAGGAGGNAGAGGAGGNSPAARGGAKGGSK